MNALASHLQIYFTTFARQQRDLSENTIRAYRDTWRILIEFLTTATGKSADRIDLDEQIWKTFHLCGKEPQMARTGKHLHELLRDERCQLVISPRPPVRTIP